MQACTQEFATAVEVEVTRLVTPGAADFKALETGRRQRTLDLATRVVEQRLNRNCSGRTDEALRRTCGQRPATPGGAPRPSQAS